MWLVYYTLIGDGGDVREVHIRAVSAPTEWEARERLDRWFGAGYAHILRVERCG
jgi:hypothetical protein